MMPSPGGDDLDQSVPWASSANDFRPTATATNTNKKRRIQRACDECRRKKIRCDAAGQSLPKGGKCSNCASFGSNCTFLKESTKRGPSKYYVQELEQRLSTIEELMRKLVLRVDIEAELTQYTSEFPSFLSGPSLSLMQMTASSLHSYGSLGPLTNLKHNHPAAHLDHGDDNEPVNGDTDDEDDDPLPQRITKTLQEFNISETPNSFHGRSSGFGLLRAATLLKKEQGIQSAPNHKTEVLANAEWERRLMAGPAPTIFTFPPNDLIRVLFDLFFLHFTPFLPVIHQPTFESQYKSGLHLKSKSFAKSVLLVCAIGSQYCDDPRVYIKEIGLQSAGWRCFAQVRELNLEPYTPPTLHDIQCYVMMSYFLQGTCAHRVSWTVIGTGIRIAQDMGMHRRKPGKGPVSLQDEQEKRAFWCLITIDRYLSSAIGRPLACQDEDFDLDFPVEVDDEYWSIPDTDGTPVLPPRQPTGVPSKISSFVASLKLYQIMALALRALYPIEKSKTNPGFGREEWEHHIVSELDSRMNQWADTVPVHLKWDPNIQNEVYFAQSAVLYTLFHNVQIFIHRPFLRPTKGSTALSLPSLSISTNAARSCIHILEALQNRGKRVPTPVLDAAINSGVVLLMAIWSAQKTGVAVDSRAAMRDVTQCIRFIKGCESSSQSAGLLADVLEDLANCGDLDLTSSAETPPSLKRGYSQSQENLPPTNSSNAHPTLRDEKAIHPFSSQQPLVGASHPILIPNQPVKRDLSFEPQHLVPTQTVLPIAEPPMSPTTHFLQAYVANLPLHGLGSASIPPSQPSNPTVLSNTDGLREGVPATFFPTSTDFSSLAHDGAGPLDWDDILKLGLQTRVVSDSIESPPLMEPNSSTSTNPPGGSSSVELLLRDPYLGYEGFGGSLGFAAEAQAFLGGGDGAASAIGGGDVDWASIFNST